MSAPPPGGRPASRSAPSNWPAADPPGRAGRAARAGDPVRHEGPRRVFLDFALGQHASQGIEEFDQAKPPDLARRPMWM